MLRGDRIQRLRIEQQALVAAELPRLPQRFSAARMAVQGESIYVAGRGADGSAQWLQRLLGDAEAPWKPLAAWPGAGQPAALVAQTGALFSA